MYAKSVLLSILFCLASILQAQVTVHGTVTDTRKVPLIGATVMVKGTSSGTATDYEGKFTLVIAQPLPVTITVSYVGYSSKDVAVQKTAEVLVIILEEESSFLTEVVVSASRVEEKILESPVTIEKLDLQTIKTSASPDFFDQMTKLKGVTTAVGSMNFNSINTRGFSAVNNVRFVQLTDGVDKSAPLLNFPMGNLVGLTENDAKSIELLPGTASALYGPNAFNGIMLMSSKDPFDYPGLNVNGKVGFSYANNDQANPLYSIEMRYAHQWKNKVGIKIVGGYMGATDWLANDYRTNLNDGLKYFEAKPPNFDGTNLYGDDIHIVVPFAPFVVDGLLNSELVDQLSVFFGGNTQATRDFLADNIPKLAPIDIRRTGFKEEELLENRRASSAKSRVSLYYRPGRDVEMVFSFAFGSGNSVYQGEQRYALRNFLSHNTKAEVFGKNFLLRSYMTQTKAGDSYNLTALGALTNERLLPTQEEWAPNYLGNYVGVLMALSLLLNRDVTELPEAVYSEAHNIARKAADGMFDFRERWDTISAVRSGLFQRGGAGFIDDSRLWHSEGTYDFTSLFKDKFGLLIGANFRQYDLFTDGTVLNEDPDGSGVNRRIRINEYGGFVQATKKLFNDRWRLSASIRYDKNENFKAQFSPRVASVVTLGGQRQHNIRASYQTGFRNPDTQAQYLYFPANTILIGSSRANAERYGIFEGGSYSKSSYDAYIQSLIAGNPDPSLLEVFYMDYIQPEKLSSTEIGYKALIGKLFIDWNAYYNWYRDFIGVASVVNIEETFHKGQSLPGVNQVLEGLATSPTVWRPFFNITDRVSSWGTAIGLNYRLRNNFFLRGNYNYMDFATAKEADKEAIEFNSPTHMFNVGLSNPNVNNSRLGFDISYRWQSTFYWVTSYGNGDIRAYGTLDASVFYAIPQWHTQLRLGGTNLMGPRYRTIIGGPYVGRMFFFGVTYDNALLGSGKRKNEGKTPGI